jgi:hypothetical protein
MTDEPVGSSQKPPGLSPEDAGRIVADAAHRYFESRRSRVDGFVDCHFSLAGSAAIHRKALGWDSRNLRLVRPYVGKVSVPLWLNV